MKYCQGPLCHTYDTKDRKRGPKGNKVNQTRRRTSMYYLSSYVDWQTINDGPWGLAVDPNPYGFINDTVYFLQYAGDAYGQSNSYSYNIRDNEWQNLGQK